MNIEALRKHRIKFNKRERGIAVFDLVGTFVAFWIIETLFNLSKHIPIKSNKKKLIYYSLALPLGIIFHQLFKVDSFLSEQLFNNDMNVYKLLIGVNILIISI